MEYELSCAAKMTTPRMMTMPPMIITPPATTFMMMDISKKSKRTMTTVARNINTVPTIRKARYATRIDLVSHSAPGLSQRPREESGELGLTVFTLVVAVGAKRKKMKRNVIE